MRWTMCFKPIYTCAVTGWLLLVSQYAWGDEDAAAAMARALQDPLESIKMLATDNTISFDAGEDEDDTVCNFQLQPVYALDRPDDARGRPAGGLGA